MGFHPQSVVTGIGGSTGATNNAILRADGAGGVTLKSSDVVISDAGIISGQKYNEVTITTVDSPYSPTVDDKIILVDTSAGPITITLPSPALNTGLVLYIRDISGFCGIEPVIIDAGAKLIDGQSTYTMLETYGSITVESSFNDWWIIQKTGTAIERIGVDKQLALTDSQKIFSNSAAIEFTLPQLYYGLDFTFLVGSNSFLRVNAGGAATISYLGTNTVGGGYCRSTTQGDQIRVIATFNSWVIVSLDGTWTYDS